VACTVNFQVIMLGSVYTERDRDRGFSSWYSLVIFRRTVQIECEREHFFVRANDRLDCPKGPFIHSATATATANAVFRPGIV